MRRRRWLQLRSSGTLLEVVLARRAAAEDEAASEVAEVEEANDSYQIVTIASDSYQIVTFAGDSYQIVELTIRLHHELTIRFTVALHALSASRVRAGRARANVLKDA